MRLGMYLKKERLSKNLSQTEFSERLGLSFVTYNRLETSLTYKPSFKTIDKLAQYFNCEPEMIRKML